MAIAIKESSLWANRKCLLICCIVGMANMQYGFDSAAIGALQAMPGFLKVFGYADPSLPSGYGIDVCHFLPLNLLRSLYPLRP